jgi:gliding motility-associated lipoprotein GldH
MAVLATIKAEGNIVRLVSFWILGLIFMISIISCDKYRLYEANKDFADSKWSSDSVCSYSFEIEDITQPYNILYNVRNTLNYSFYNLYVKYALIGSDGKEISSDLQEIQLMDAKTGEPFGSGMGDIFDNRIIAKKNFKFPVKGKYTFTAKQYMRKNPIDEIMSFGIRVERAQ